MPPPAGSGGQADAESMIPVICCWGCGVDGGEAHSFKNCPKCIELSMVPARFCSKSCFASHWKRHREWHAQRAERLEASINLRPVPDPQQEYLANDLAARRLEIAQKCGTKYDEYLEAGEGHMRSVPPRWGDATV